MATDLQIPDERFTCQSCGRCCRMWTITVDESKVEQLRREDWPGGDPFRKRLGVEGDSYSIRMVDGRCFFLDENNHCRIHSKLGYNAKPDGCKGFPLLVNRVAGNTHLRLSFYCPTVTAGEGKRLREQKRWIQNTVKAAGDVTREAPLTLDGEVQLTARDVTAIESVLVDLLQRDDHDLADGLAAGAAALHRLHQRASTEGKQGVQAALKELKQADATELIREGRQAGKAARAGPVLSLFLGHDCRPGGLARFGRFFSVRLANLGLARLSSRLMNARASHAAIRKLPFSPKQESRKLLRRYLLHKLNARRHLTGEHSLTSGFNLLAAAYAVISLLARLRAVHQGRDSVSTEDVSMAVQAADLLVMEHTALYQGGMLADLTEAVLSQEHLCGSLLHRIEPL